MEKYLLFSKVKDEFSESPLSQYNFEEYFQGRGITLYGNGHFNGYEDELFTEANNFLSELIENDYTVISDSYDENLIYIALSLQNHFIDDVTVKDLDFIRSLAWHLIDKTIDNEEIIILAMNYIDEEGRTFNHATLTGFTQSDWIECIYSTGTDTKKLEADYFHTGAELEVYETDTKPTEDNFLDLVDESSPMFFYAYEWYTVEEMKKELEKYTGYKAVDMFYMDKVEEFVTTYKLEG